MSRKTAIWTVLTILVLGSIAVTTYVVHTKNRFANITNYPPQNMTIVALGDSLTAGFGSTKDNDYVTVLSQKIQKPIINKGVIGDTTAQALKRVDNVLAQKPGFVIVYLGGNDVLQRVPIDTTFLNLEKIITRLQDGGAVVILVGVRGGLFNDPFSDRFEQLAFRYKTIYVPDMILDVMAQKDHMSDAVHPNDGGYAYIAETLYEQTRGLFDNVQSENETNI